MATVQLRELLERWTRPCPNDCEHSQCPLLRELWKIAEDERIKDVLAEAQKTVKPIVDEEQEGENVGDLMSLRLDAAASTPTERCTCDHFLGEHAETGQCSKCGLFCGPVSNEVAQADLRAWSGLDDGSDIWCDDCRGYTHRSDCPSYKPAAASTDAQDES